MRITANRIEDKEWSTKTQTRPLILPGGVPELSLASGEKDSVSKPFCQLSALMVRSKSKSRSDHAFVSWLCQNWEQKTCSSFWFKNVCSYCSCNFWTFRRATPPAFAEFSACIICGFASAKKKNWKNFIWTNSLSIRLLRSEESTASADVLPGDKSPSQDTMKALIYGTDVYLSPIHASLPVLCTISGRTKRAFLRLLETVAWVQQWRLLWPWFSSPLF